MISSRSAKDLLAFAVSDSRNPEDIAKEKGLIQITSSADMEIAVLKIIGDNPAVVDDYKAGKLASLEYLVGQGMKVFRGAIDPSTLRASFIEHLG